MPSRLHLSRLLVTTGPFHGTRRCDPRDKTSEDRGKGEYSDWVRPTSATPGKRLGRTLQKGPKRGGGSNVRESAGIKTRVRDNFQ